MTFGGVRQPFEWWSGWQDSNLRQPHSKCGTLAWLSYTLLLAPSPGFEPGFSPSKGAVLPLNEEGLVLKGIDFARSGHDHNERAQYVMHADCPGVLSQDIRQSAIRHRAFVKISAKQHHAAIP